MSIAEISRKVEITFWDWAIPTLSVSPFFQKCVRIFYHILHRSASHRLIWFGAGVSIFGFLNGMFAFWLIVR
jgi:hypothetical protein